MNRQDKDQVHQSKDARSIPINISSFSKTSRDNLPVMFCNDFFKNNSCAMLVTAPFNLTASFRVSTNAHSHRQDLLLIFNYGPLCFEVPLLFEYMKKNTMKVFTECNENFYDRQHQRETMKREKANIASFKVQAIVRGQ